MHASELVHLAASVATHGHRLVSQPTPLPERHIAEYWLASRIRLDGWLRSFKQFAVEAARKELPSDNWTRIRPIVEEVLLSEVLTRVWAAVVSAAERHQSIRETEPLVHSVFIGHQEARARALRLLVDSPGVELEDAIEFNSLRRMTERWCDLLVGNLSRWVDVTKYAYDPRRAQEFARDLREDSQAPHRSRIWPTLLASMRLAYHDPYGGPAASPALNQRIAASLLACFSPDTYSSLGQFQADWVARLTYAADDVDGLVTEFLRVDLPRVRVRDY